MRHFAVIVKVLASSDQFQADGAFKAATAMEVLLVLISVGTVDEPFSAKFASKVEATLHFSVVVEM